MARPIKLTRELIQNMVQDFEKALNTAKLSDGKISYSKSFEYTKSDTMKATVWLEPVAFAKMMMLVQRSSDEIAWHGFVDRTAKDTFIISDIVVYPQEVTGTTVTTDQTRYQQWTLTIDDERYNKMHFQGHSHVNMGVTPSDVDEALYASILSQLTDEDFYIFLVINKRMDIYCRVYDMKANVMYEKDDVAIGILSDGGDLDGFYTESMKMVEKRTYTAPATGSAYSYGYGQHGATGYSSPDRTIPTIGSAKVTGKSGKKKDSDEPKNLHGRPYPGLYGYVGDDDDDVDYDAMIFGRRSEWYK